jgi:hypothetical protein
MKCYKNINIKTNEYGGRGGGGVRKLSNMFFLGMKMPNLDLLKTSCN